MESTETRREVWRRPSKGEERRAQLLEALEDLLKQRPLSEISIDHIATAAGVKRSAFYFYFANKEDAVAGLLSDVFDAIVAGGDDFMHRASFVSDPSIQSAVEVLGEAQMRLWTDWKAREHIILAMLDARADAGARAQWDDWVERFVGPTVAVINSERVAGRAPGGFDPTKMARTLLGMNVAALERLSRAQADPQEVAETLECLSHAWVQSIYAPPMLPMRTGSRSQSDR